MLKKRRRPELFGQQIFSMKSFINSVVCICLFLSCPLFASKYVVRKDGMGDFITIQAAIDAADINGIDTIIVSPGVYYENINYNGKNIILTSADPDAPKDTIIDGQQNDFTVVFSGIENANCMLTGFTITNGVRGIMGHGTQATINNCIVSNNSAEGIGGCDGLIEGCIVRGNERTGLYFCNGRIESCIVKENLLSGISFCDGVISNSVIVDNYTAYYGGGISLCDGTIINCVISNNHAGRNGGGIYECNDIINCLISNNSAGGEGGDIQSGGGIDKCQGNIINCTIIGNYAVGRGGGVNGCKGVIENCIIWYNTAGIYDDLLAIAYSISHSCYPEATGETNTSEKPLLKNIYSTNPEEWDLHLIAGSPCIDMGTNTVSVELRDIDIDGNPRIQDSDNDGTVTIDMGAYEFSSNSQPIIALSENLFHFTSHEAKTGSEIQRGTFTISNWGPEILNWKILESIPWLSVDTIEGTSHNRSDVTVVTFSIDNTGLAPGDYEGTISIVSDSCSNSPAIIKVFLTIYQHHLVPDEFSTIQSAINSANNHDKVTVYPGTYNENLTMNGKNIILSSLNPLDPNVVNNTVLEERGYGQLILFRGTENEDCLVTGFTITGGYAYMDNGGGILGNGAKATLSYCILKDNRTRYGDGDAIYDLDGLITDCIIENNSVIFNSNTGAIDDCDGTIRRCLFNENACSGIYDCSASIENCTFTNNSKGICYSSGTIRKCIITNNRTGINEFIGQTLDSVIRNNGTGIVGTYKMHDVHNCIIANNTHIGIAGNGTVTNCTIVGNGESGIANKYSLIEDCVIAFNGGYGLLDDGDTLPSVKHCLFYGNSLGLCVYEPDRFINTVSELNLRSDCSDNISGDPLILNWKDNDLHLWPESPCIDSGNPNYIPTDDEKDMGGNPRVRDGNNDGSKIIDIGAFEAGDSQTLLCDTTDIVFYANPFTSSQTQIIRIGSHSFSPLRWESTTNCSWLKVTPRAGELTNETIQIVIETKNTTALSPGIYQESIYINKKDGDAEPIVINISLDMRAPIYVPDDYGTIQQAIYASSDHDLIIVEPNIYNENIIIPNKEIAIRSLNPIDDNVIATTIIQKHTNSPIVKFSGGTKTRVLEGFTIQNGISSNGAGIYFDNCSSIVNNCVVKNNQTSSYGGGCYVKGSTIDFNGCFFINNSANNQGGAIYADSGSNVEFSGCKFQGNFISESATTGYGGGVYNLNSTMNFNDCSFTNNSTRFAGGAVCNYEAEAAFSQCTFSGNIGYDNPADGGAGCAVYNWITSPTFVECIFSDNVAYGPFSSGAAVYNFNKSSPEFTDCTFISNQCIGGHSQGGAIWNRQYSYPVFNRCKFIDNFASYGGAVNNVIYSSLTMNNCIILANFAAYGGALYTEDSYSYFYNCTLVNNSATNGNAVASDSSYSYVRFQNSLLWDQGNEVWNGGALLTSINYCDIHGGWTGTGNIDVNPLFADISSSEPINWDVHLKSQAGRWNQSFYRSSDFNSDKIVDHRDFSVFAAKWLSAEPSLLQDLNRDNAVNEQDLLIFIDKYLTSGQGGVWVYDDVTSPCIDAGNPTTDWTKEPWPHGQRINMGVYGGTSQASMSLSQIGLLEDLSNDNIVNMNDLSIFAQCWGIRNDLANADFNRDTHVDFDDLILFSERWLSIAD